MPVILFTLDYEHYLLIGEVRHASQVTRKKKFNIDVKALAGILSV